MRANILFLAHRPPPYNGVSILNEDILSSQLLQRTYQVDVVSINTARNLKDIERKSLKKLFLLIGITFKLLLKLLNKRYQLCYFSLTPTGIGFYKDFFLIMLVKLFRVRLVYHIHGKGISLQKQWPMAQLYRIVFQGAKVILVSDKLVYDLARYVPAKNIFILSPGVKQVLSDLEFKGLCEKRKQKSEINLLFLSNLIESKGVWVALKAAKILAEKNYQFRFFYLGGCYNISEQDFLRRVQEYQLDRIVQYLGFRNGKDKFEILEKSDIFVYPTYNDIFGIVNVEAMQFGLPVVSTHEGAIPEIVEDGTTGFLVPQKDPETLADKIEYLMNDGPLRQDMGKAARKKYLSCYTFERFEQRLVDILKKVVEE